MKDANGFTPEEAAFLTTRIAYRDERILEVQAENEELNWQLEQREAEVRRLQGYLEKIAFVNCTCDDWGNSTNTDPAPHDAYCMYRVMTGYQAASGEVTE